MLAPITDVLIFWVIIGSIIYVRMQNMHNAHYAISEKGKIVSVRLGVVLAQLKLALNLR